MIAFEIPAQAIPFARAGSNGARRFTRPAQAAFMQAVSLYARRAMAGQEPFSGPVELTVRAIFPWPESWSVAKRIANGRWKTSKPDLSNCLKLLEDAMNGIAYQDDAQVVSLRAQKLWGEAPRVIVSVAQMETEE